MSRTSGLKFKCSPPDLGKRYLDPPETLSRVWPCPDRLDRTHTRVDPSWRARDVRSAPAPDSHLAMGTRTHRRCSCWCCASVQTSLAWGPLQPRPRHDQPPRRFLAEAVVFGARFPRLTPTQSRAFRELLDLGRVWVAEACGLLDSEGWRSRRGTVLALPGCLAPLWRRPRGEHLCPVGVPGSAAARRGRGACISAWVEPEVLLKTRGSQRKHLNVRAPGTLVLAAALAGD